MEHEAQRLKELKAYLAGHGHLPPAHHRLARWMTGRIANGDSQVPGMKAELEDLLQAYPGYRKSAEAQKLKDLRNYLADHGHLPASMHPLGHWIRYRINHGDGPVPGVTAELHKLRQTHPLRMDKAILWAPQAAAGVAERAALPGTSADRNQSVRLKRLRNAVGRARVPDALVSPALMVIGAPKGSDVHDARWREVFADFTAWVDRAGRLPNRRSTDTEEYRMANWLNVQRANQRAGRLRAPHAEQLSVVPGALRDTPAGSAVGHARA